MLHGGSRSGSGGNGKDRLVEHHMARYEDSTRGKVVASVPLVIRGVPKEDTKSNGEPACEERWRWCSGKTHTQRLEGDRSEEGY